MNCYSLKRNEAQSAISEGGKKSTYIVCTCETIFILHLSSYTCQSDAFNNNKKKKEKKKGFAPEILPSFFDFFPFK